MVKVYTPKYTKPKDEVKDEKGFTIKQLERAKVFERNLIVKRHEGWKASEYFEHVMGIIDQWTESMSRNDQFSVEALLKATPEEVKERMILAAKVKIEAENLKKKLS